MLKSNAIIRPNEPVHREALRFNVVTGLCTRRELIETKRWPITYTHREIKSVRDLKETLRAGQWAWPGGYPLYLISADSEPLSFESARECFREICDAMTNDYGAPSWRIVGCEINEEDQQLYCSHSGQRIEASY